MIELNSRSGIPRTRTHARTHAHNTHWTKHLGIGISAKTTGSQLLFRTLTWAWLWS